MKCYEYSHVANTYENSHTCIMNINLSWVFTHGIKNHTSTVDIAVTSMLQAYTEQLDYIAA